MLGRDLPDSDAEQSEVLDLEPYPNWAHQPMRQIFDLMGRGPAPREQYLTVAAAAPERGQPRAIRPAPPYANGEPRGPVIAPEFMQEIARRENPGRADDQIPLGTVNGIHARGRYQITPGGLSHTGLTPGEGPNWLGRTELDGREYRVSENEFLRSREWQDWALRSFLMEGERQLFANRSTDHVDQRINGLRAPFGVTMSGLAAAAHRQGAGAVRQYLDDLAASNWDSGSAIQNLEAASARGDENARRRLARHRSIETRLREFERVPYRLLDLF